jgi:hypothetical protein
VVSGSKTGVVHVQRESLPESFLDTRIQVPSDTPVGGPVYDEASYISHGSGTSRGNL